MLNKIFSKLRNCYLSAIFGLLIIITTAAHWFLFSHATICQQRMDNAEKLFVLLTAPFDITCEGILVNRILENLVPLLFLLIIEFFLGQKLDSYLKNIFIAAILSTYLVSLFSLSYQGFPANGTSVIGISLLIFSVFWCGVKIIPKLVARYREPSKPDAHAILIFVIYLVVGIVSLICIFALYLNSLEGLFFHGLGGLLFPIVLCLVLRSNLITICSGSKSSI